MKIGVLKESRDGERRVAMSPETTVKLSRKGWEILVEQGAGVAARFNDESFRAAGAQIVSTEQVYQADILLKVRRPADEELARTRAGQVLIALMEACPDDPLIEQVRGRGLQAIALERIPRISRAQSMDVLSSQANIAGYQAVLAAASHYGRFVPLMMTAAGSAKPARLVVLGVGVAGLQAIATAKRLGADVWAYDVRPETREQIISVGAKPIDLDLGESGSGSGGYARELSAEARARQQELLAAELGKADIIVTTALIPCRPAPQLVTPEVVEQLRPGSVIVDLAAAQGGNCPLTRVDQVIEHKGVVLVGHSNYPSMMPTDASSFLARNMANLLEIVIADSEQGPCLADLAADEITAAALLAP